MTRHLRRNTRTEELKDENGIVHTTGRSLKKINYAEVEHGLDYLDEEQNTEDVRNSGGNGGDNYNEENENETWRKEVKQENGLHETGDDDYADNIQRRRGRRKRVHDPEEEDESFHEEDAIDEEIEDDDVNTDDDDEEGVSRTTRLKRKKLDNFIVPDPDDEDFADDDDDEENLHNTRSVRRSRLRERTPQKPTRPIRQLRSRTRSTLFDGEENNNNDGENEALSLADEIRELQEDSPIREKRALRERTKQVDYRIPPPLTNFTVDEFSTRPQQRAPYLTASPRRGRGGWNTSQYTGPNRRLFPTGGPFGGNDMVTIFGQNTNFYGQSSGNNPKLILDSDSSEDEILPIDGKSKKKIPDPLTDKKKKKKQEIADLDPLGVDMNINFDEVGGLDNYIEQLKEMVSLPLLYPEIYQKFNITPPRGVLFHGPPGTGKTLMARALAASCSTETRKITFFMRKGADILSKWVGEAERQLRLLFEEAKKQQPSIIFFDEIDGLAPVRSSKQEQIHASIVSTMLALMDGMDNRGQVIVIGATNRPDAVDPALRRPGRFDREFFFPLPDVNARKTILKIHMKKWEPQPSDKLVEKLAEMTKGYGGADLRSLCTEAALFSIQRNYPQIYRSDDKLKIDITKIKVNSSDFMLALRKIVPSSNRSSGNTAQQIPENVKPLLCSQFDKLKELIEEIMPDIHSNTDQSKSLIQEYLDYEFVVSNDDNDGFDKQELITSLDTSRICKPRLLITGPVGAGQEYIGGAILNTLEKFNVQRLDVPSLVSDSTRTVDSAIVQSFIEARKRQPSILYIPNFDIWLKTIPESAVLTLSSLLRSLTANEKLFLLCLSESLGPESIINDTLLSSFGFAGNVFEIESPTREQKSQYLDKILNNLRLHPASFLLKRKRTKPLPKLPLVTSLKDAIEIDGEGNPLSKEEALRKKLKQFQHQDMKLKNVLKIKLSGLMDLFKNRYKRFRKPPIDDSFLVHLFEPQMQNDPNWQPAYVKDKDMILEVATGRRFFNMDLDIIEERLWNGYYSEPKQYLKDIECIYRDANTSGDRERIIKASEMYANAQMGIEDISTPELVAECKATRQRDLERQELYLKDEERRLELEALAVKEKMLSEDNHVSQHDSSNVELGVGAGSQMQLQVQSENPNGTNPTTNIENNSIPGASKYTEISNSEIPEQIKVDKESFLIDRTLEHVEPKPNDQEYNKKIEHDKHAVDGAVEAKNNKVEENSEKTVETLNNDEVEESSIALKSEVVKPVTLNENVLSTILKSLLERTDSYTVNQMEELRSKIMRIIWEEREVCDKEVALQRIEDLISLL
ncbi:ATPase histone chaperone YTA7 [Nakaseomyces bracarensis]|uniref:ATPase histone chaperone YTA7 n=1 Tax=Nakaseomyces bracarensis TaxID=273131 RepID=A0ABR4NWX1_9SACH